MRFAEDFGVQNGLLVDQKPFQGAPGVNRKIGAQVRVVSRLAYALAKVWSDGDRFICGTLNEGGRATNNAFFGIRFITLMTP